MGKVLTPRNPFDKKKPKQPTANCRFHGEQPIRVTCIQCWHELVEANTQLRTVMEGTPEVLRRCAGENEEQAKRIKSLEAALIEVGEEVHKLKCGVFDSEEPGDIDDADAEGPHAPLCARIQDILVPPAKEEDVPNKTHEEELNDDAVAQQKEVERAEKHREGLGAHRMASGVAAAVDGEAGDKSTGDESLPADAEGGSVQQEDSGEGLQRGEAARKVQGRGLHGEEARPVGFRGRVTLEGDRVE